MKRSIFVLMIFSLIATGCEGNEEYAVVSEVVDTTIENNSQSDTSPIEESLDTLVTEEQTFVGVCGEKIAVNSGNTGIEYDKPYYTFDDWTYLSDSNGRALNNVADAECFDGILCINNPEQIVDLYKVETGESVCGLELINATATYLYNAKQSTGILAAMSAEFTGQKTFSGYIYVSTEYDEYSYEGEVIFLVDDGQWAGMPFVKERSTVWSNSFFSWCANAPELKLGSVNDYADYELPKAGEFVRVEVTFNKICINSILDSNLGYKPSTAVMIDMHIL